MNSTTSKFVQLTPYLLMEYMYADSQDPETYFTNTGSPDVGYNKLINGFRNNSVQVFNPQDDYDVTHNTAQNSVVKISENSFVTLDSNLIIPFNDYSDNLTNTQNLPVVFPSNLNVVYDTVRYHIRSGYVFQNIDGAILSIEFQDSNLEYVTVSQILLRKGTEQDYVLNPSPVAIGSNIYDKYFEVKIPSLKSMNDTYLATSESFKPDSLAGKISSSGNGFYDGAPIRISIWEIQSTDNYEGYDRYNSARVALLSLEQEDPFSNIGAVIRESDIGEFFEYFATDNDGFVEDFILFQNSIGNSYFIDHQIEVLEQIGASIIVTYKFQSIQTTAYDSPNFYRPIVKNAAYASAFFLRYTMSLVNNKDESRTIRVATYSSNEPYKWGLNITRIQMNEAPQTQKIYNRVYSQPQINIGSNNIPQPKEIIKFTNVFIQQSSVTASISNLSLNGGTITDETGASQNIALGTGKLTIKISPFDNYYKFKFIKSTFQGDPVAIDLTNSQYYICFINNKGEKNYIPSYLDNNLANPSMGELVFKIDESNSVDILNFNDRRFFITTSNGGPVLDNYGSTQKSLIGNTSSSLQGIEERIRTTPNPTISSMLETNSSIRLASPNTYQNLSSSVMYWGYWNTESESSPKPDLSELERLRSSVDPSIRLANAASIASELLPTNQNITLANADTYRRYAESLGMTTQNTSSTSSLENLRSNLDPSVRLANAVSMASELLTPNQNITLANEETYRRYAESLGFVQTTNVEPPPPTPVIQGITPVSISPETVLNVPSISETSAASNLNSNEFLEATNAFRIKNAQLQSEELARFRSELTNLI